jgi:hypothetical protein
VDDGFIVFKLDNLAVKGSPNPGPRHYLCSFSICYVVG